MWLAGREYWCPISKFAPTRFILCIIFPQDVNSDFFCILYFDYWSLTSKFAPTRFIFCIIFPQEDNSDFFVFCICILYSVFRMLSIDVQCQSLHQLYILHNISPRCQLWFRDGKNYSEESNHHQRFWAIEFLLFWTSSFAGFLKGDQERECSKMG